MTASEFLTTVLVPGLARVEQILGPKPTNSPEAEVLLLAIAGQESNWLNRRQIGGPARGYWQFESGGGVAAVLGHRTAGPWARQLCASLNIPSDRATVFEAMAWNDYLAVGMARLNLWIDPQSLPVVGDQKNAWLYYNRVWAPGKPDENRWAAVYPQAVNAAI